MNLNGPSIIKTKSYSKLVVLDQEWIGKTTLQILEIVEDSECSKEDGITLFVTINCKAFKRRK